ncbi:hypothetical protein EAY64_11535 [Aquitalea palustris]|uniref:Uncharacterized protein n=1 Tax=Aquitalea palustris TaxID=2480983 RepID=A0A454JHL1_9NEIS|nr:hypothetical protein EAY64_11535 [Aquitalea palustris]
MLRFAAVQAFAADQVNARHVTSRQAASFSCLLRVAKMLKLSQTSPRAAPGKSRVRHYTRLQQAECPAGAGSFGQSPSHQWLCQC